MIKVFYNPLQSAAKNESFSPSATKPKLVAEAFSKLPGVILEDNFKPVTEAMLCQVHDPKYVKGVLGGSLPNGFGNRLPEVAATLPWTSGSMLAAALYAIKHSTAACSLTSGFHHAGYNYGHGFCTFNGLMVTAVELLERGYKKIGILDLDAHLGDGTLDIIQKLKLQEKVAHYTFGGEFGAFKTEGEWLDSLLDVITQKFSDVDVILYQAGADPHEKDPLGGYLSSETMQDRDMTVFTACKVLGIPVAWNLAGGYQKPIEKVIELHVTTMMECLEAFTQAQEESSPILRKTFAIQDWSDWDKTVFEAAQHFRECSGVYPNILLASQATHQRIDFVANNSVPKRIGTALGEPPTGFVSLSGFESVELSLEFCIKNDLPQDTFVLVFDSDPDGGLPLPEEDNLMDEALENIQKRKVS